MKKFKLIKSYPGCGLKIGSIIDMGNSTQRIDEFGNFVLKELEEFTEFWEKVIEKDYEILSYKSVNLGVIITKRKNGKFLNSLQTDINGYFDENNYINSKDHIIHSIKRLSDGEIFSIDDKVLHANNVSNPIGIIESFHLMSNGLWFKTDNYDVPMSYIAVKTKQLLFTTEDGVDIFEGDSIYAVDDNFQLLYTMFASKEDSRVRAFSSRKTAEDYIILNKPCFSLNDYYGLFDDDIKDFGIGYKLKQLVKSKL